MDTVSKKPCNVLILCPDQLRADYLGCYGHSSIGTRHMDALAAASVRFSNAYCASPLCGPSRISFVTSTYVGEHGHRNYGSTISPDVSNLVGALKAHGYVTAQYGKNDMFDPGRMEEMWDEYKTIFVGNRSTEAGNDYAWRGYSSRADSPYESTAAVRAYALDFIQRRAGSEEPFLLWVNFHDPHPAYCCPPPYDTLFDPAAQGLPAGWHDTYPRKEPVRNAVWREHSKMGDCSDDDIRETIARYMGKVRHVDDSIGEIVTRLKETGQWEDTLVVFWSDHGDLLGDYRMTHKLPIFTDNLTRVPFLLRHPRKDWGGREFEGLVESVDIAPTVLDALGLEVPLSMVGRSLVPGLDGGGGRGRDSVLVEAGVGAPTLKRPLPDTRFKAPYHPTSFGPGAMVRSGPWKLSCYADDQDEFYNLDEDPRELRNRIDDPACAEVLQRMRGLLIRRLLAVKVRDIGGVEWPRKGETDPRKDPIEWRAH